MHVTLAHDCMLCSPTILPQMVQPREVLVSIPRLSRIRDGQIHSFAAPRNATSVDDALQNTGSDSSCERQLKQERQQQQWVPYQHSVTALSTNVPGISLCSINSEQIRHDHSPWGVLEQQQHQLESLQKTIDYCEDRSRMGRAIRCREAFARARLLRDQLRQQEQQRQQRRQRNSMLMNDAVSWSLQKLMTSANPAERRLSHCLAELHKYIQETVPPPAFNAVSTILGVGGTGGYSTDKIPRSNQPSRQYPCHFIPQDCIAVYGAESNKRHRNQIFAPDDRSIVRCTTDGSDVLNVGAADISAAQESTQAKTVLVPQKQQAANDSNNMKQLLSLEGKSQAHGEIPGNERPCELTNLIKGTSGLKPGGDSHCGSPSIPEETPEAYRGIAVPPSLPQRLIAQSELSCNINVLTDSAKKPTGGNQDISAHSLPSRTAAKTDTGEQHWLNLASQVSMLQEVLLRTQGHQRRKLQRKKQSSRQQIRPQQIKENPAADPQRVLVDTQSPSSDIVSNSSGVSPLVKISSPLDSGGQSEVAVPSISSSKPPNRLPTQECSVGKLRQPRERTCSQRQHFNQVQRKREDKDLSQSTAGTVQCGAPSRSTYGMKTPARKTCLPVDFPNFISSGHGAGPKSPSKATHQVRGRSETAPTNRARCLSRANGEHQCTQVPSTAPSSKAPGCIQKRFPSPLTTQLPVTRQLILAATPRPMQQLLSQQPVLNQETQVAGPPCGKTICRKSKTTVRSPSGRETKGQRHPVLRDVAEKRSQEGFDDSQLTSKGVTSLDPSIKGLPSADEVAELLMSL